jgi:hypothetical protein
MPASPFANPDPSVDVPKVCGCGAEGHALLRLFLSRKLALVSNLESRCPTRDRHRLSRAGLISLIEGAQGGWPRGWWTAQLTAAGYVHAATLSDQSAVHAGAGGCGAPWRPDGFCGGCHEPRPLTVGMARAIIAAIADPKARADAIYASQFVCARHGRARMSMVRTDKNCAVCGEGFRRDFALG